MRKALLLVSTLGMPLLVASCACAFLLAVSAKYAEPSPGNVDISAITRFWIAVMDATNGDTNPTGWQRIYQFLIHLAIAWGAVRIYAAAVGIKLEEWMARWLLRDHVVVVTGSLVADQASTRTVGKSVALASELAIALSRRHGVVMCLVNLDEEHRDLMWSSGVVVVTGARGVEDLMVRTGARRAKAVYALFERNEDNIAVANFVLSRTPASCFCRLSPLDFKQGFDAEDYFDRRLLFRLRPFNEAEWLARGLMRAFPPDALLAAQEDRVHVVLVGIGSIGRAVLLQMARIGHYRSGLKPRITIIDQAAGCRWESLRGRYPALESWVDVAICESRIEDLDAPRIARILAGPTPVSGVYISTPGEVANLRLARLVLGLGVPGARPVFPVVVMEARPDGVLSDFQRGSTHSAQFHVFEPFQRGGEPARDILEGVDDEIARRMHEAYCAKDDALRKADPLRGKAEFNRPWAELPESARNANRMSGDHFEVKLRAVSCRLVRAGEAPEATWSGEELEVLARMEHARWWADRTMDGWTRGSRDNARRRHPDLIPYDDLEEPVRQLDRDAVLHIVEQLRLEGWIVARVTG
jgi:hypothetical protein